ncbi:MAG: hypothetical protein ACRC37_06765 [Lentisphaeria bacterium]
MKDENCNSTDQIPWSKLNTWSNNYCTHKFFIDDVQNNGCFKPTVAFRNFFIAMLVIPVVLIAVHQPNPAQGGAFFLILFLTFFAVSLFLFVKNMRTNIIFSKDIMAFYKSTSHHQKCYDQTKLSKLVPFSQIKALQILHYTSSGHERSKYNCFQLNLVRIDNSRINVIAHADYLQIKNDAQKLSEFINIPLIEK